MASRVDVAPPPELEALTPEVVARLLRAALRRDCGILWVEDVAELLGCSRDFVYRIPVEQLPSAKPAKRKIILLKNFIRYIEFGHRPAGAIAPPGTPQNLENLLEEVEEQVLDPQLDGARERHQRRTR